MTESLTGTTVAHAGNTTEETPAEQRMKESRPEIHQLTPEELKKAEEKLKPLNADYKITDGQSIHTRHSFLFQIQSDFVKTLRFRYSLVHPYEISSKLKIFDNTLRKQTPQLLGKIVLDKNTRDFKHKKRSVKQIIYPQAELENILRSIDPSHFSDFDDSQENSAFDLFAHLVSKGLIDISTELLKPFLVENEEFNKSLSKTEKELLKEILPGLSGSEEIKVILSNHSDLLAYLDKKKSLASLTENQTNLRKEIVKNIISSISVMDLYELLTHDSVSIQLHQLKPKVADKPILIPPHQPTTPKLSLVDTARIALLEEIVKFIGKDAPSFSQEPISTRKPEDVKGELDAILNSYVKKLSSLNKGELLSNLDKTCKERGKQIKEDTLRSEASKGRAGHKLSRGFESWKNIINDEKFSVEKLSTYPIAHTSPSYYNPKQEEKLHTFSKLETRRQKGLAIQRPTNVPGNYLSKGGVSRPSISTSISGSSASQHRC